MKLIWFCDISYSLQIGKRPLVKTAVIIIRKLCYERRDEVNARMICAGWDDKEGGQVKLFGNFYFYFKFEKIIYWSIILKTRAEIANRSH